MMPALCEGTVCNWTNGNNLEPGGVRTATVSIRIADDAEEGSRFKAMLNANSKNQADSSDRFATVSTEITAQPVPALAITLQTLPTAVVALGDEFKTVDRSDQPGCCGGYRHHGDAGCTGGCELCECPR
jgi:hypothetical protein